MRRLALAVVTVAVTVVIDVQSKVSTTLRLQRIQKS